MGGKKKASKPPLKKESKYKLPTMFVCPICDAKSAVVVKIIRRVALAHVRCRACGISKSDIGCCHLEQGVDVFFKFRAMVEAKDESHIQEQHIAVNVVRPRDALFAIEEAERYEDEHGGGSAGRLESVAPSSTMQSATQNGGVYTAAAASEAVAARRRGDDDEDEGYHPFTATEEYDDVEALLNL